MKKENSNIQCVSFQVLKQRFLEAEAKNISFQGGFFRNVRV